jgi:hypothetical protein
MKPLCYVLLCALAMSFRHTSFNLCVVITALFLVYFNVRDRE